MINDPDANGRTPSLAPAWLPETLDPTPGDLVELSNRIGTLIYNLKHYETIVGETIRDVCGGAFFEDWVFLDLLDALDHLGLWNVSGVRLCEVTVSSIWTGWPQETTEWWRELTWRFHELVSWLNVYGIPYSPCSFRMSLTFADDEGCHFERPISEKFVKFAGSAHEETTGQSIVPPNAKLGTLEIDPDLDFLLTDVLGMIQTQIAEMLDEFACRPTPDNRRMRLDLSKIRHFGSHVGYEPEQGYYPDELVDSDPFEAAMSIEALEGVKLADGGDPVWLLAQHKQYKSATAAFGEAATFAQYMERLHPQKLFGDKKRDRELLERDQFTPEVEGISAQPLPGEADGALDLIKDPPTRTSDESSSESYDERLKKLPDRCRHALIAFDQAELACATPADKFTIAMAWRWVEENYEDRKFPGFTAFRDYITQSRGKVGRNVNRPRKGRQGRSIVAEDET